MLDRIPESDWKTFRLVRAESLEAFCRGVLEEVSRRNDDPGSSAHERYVAMHALIVERDRVLSELFDDLRRSTMMLRLAALRARGLVSDEQMARFTERTRERVAALTSFPLE